MPPAPQRAFASDNAAGAHPAVIDAIVAANVGHAVAYGTRSLDGARCRVDSATCSGRRPRRSWCGTEPAPTSWRWPRWCAPPTSCCAREWAHIAVDETGAPERALGAKILTAPAPEAKLHPDQIDALARYQGDMHHAQPGVVSITQSTELGTVYTPDEVAAICDSAHRLGMVVHMDGARLANATAALGGTVAAMRSFTVDAGVDVLSFGGTKAGLAGGEAVVFLNPTLAQRAKYVRKQVNQLPSKMRFVAAQFQALLEDDRWIHLAEHSNSMCQHLYRLTADIPAVVHAGAPVVNSVFPTIPAEAIEPLQDWSFFWDWDIARSQVRWMTAWDTTARGRRAVRRRIATPAGVISKRLRKFLAIYN